MYRIVNLCAAMVGRSELEKIAVAAVFHDLGIWTSGTFDYIGPSVVLAHDYLVARGREDWTPEIEGMIADHHKITTSTADPDSRGRPKPAFRLESANARQRHQQSPFAPPEIFWLQTPLTIGTAILIEWPYARACGAQEVGICLSC